MKFKERIPKELFREDGQFLGRPADFEDRIVERRLRLVKGVPGFLGRELELLDIGCGNGASMFKLSTQFRRCTGIEITNEHREAFENFKFENKIENCDYIITDVVKTKPVKQYNRLISFEVIEHLDDERGVAYYYDSLVKGGLMAITVPNKWWIFETHGARLPLLPWNRVPFFSWLPTPIHEKFANARIYTKGRIMKLLENNNFEVLDCQYVMAPMDVLPDGWFKNFIIKTFFKNDSTIFPFKATAIFVLARKN